MAVVLNFTEEAVFVNLQRLLVQLVPEGTEVIRAFVNRVPTPRGPNYILMSQLRRTRLETNTDTTLDVIFKGTIAGTVLTVNGVLSGEIYVGTVIGGAGISPGTTIVGVGSVPDTYKVTPSQMVMTETTMYAGATFMLQPTQLDIQLDVHGPLSGDNIQILSTVLRDEYTTNYFATCPIDIQMLYPDEPRQVPFRTAESQWDTRWVMEISLQVNQVAQLSQQFADVVDVGLIDVDVVYPP